MQLPSPVHHIQNFSNYNTSLYIKRDDLIHHEFGGNKWRKLKYNIQAFKEGNYSHLITFGGPFSNHIAATASACKYYDIPCIGLIRGARLDSLNPTLQKAQSNGMVLVPISKNEYRLKEDSEEVQNVLLSYPNAFLLPEGGTNRLAVLGTEEIAVELNEQISDIDIIVTPIGTGGTAAGIINTSRDDQLVLVINSMKNVELENTLSSMVQANKSNWEIIHDYQEIGLEDKKVPGKSVWKNPINWFRRSKNKKN